MPAEEGVGFEAEGCLFPVLHATRKEDEPETIGLGKGRFFDLTVKDNQLLAQKCVLGDAVSFATGEVCDGAEHNRVMGWLGEMQVSSFKKSKETAEPSGQTMEENEHVVGLQESCQKLSAECMQRSVGVKFRTSGVFSQHRGFEFP